ncbi:MAG: thioredoxin family protein [Chloroflexota bacterium]
MMAVTAERFAQGLTYDEYKARMTRNQDRFQANERRVVLDPADLDAFTQLPSPLRVLVLAEDWCGDVIDNLPILGRLAAESGKLEVRIFLRDQHLDLIDQYLKEGKYRSIPVFVFFDDRFAEIGRFIERPASVSERRARYREELSARHPEFGAPDAPPDQLSADVRARLMQEMAQKREEWKPLEERDTIQALRAIVERAGS